MWIPTFVKFLLFQSLLSVCTAEDYLMLRNITREDFQFTEPQSLVYDGDHSIYIIGLNHTRDIKKFNIYTETMETVGVFQNPPGDSFSILDADGALHQLGSGQLQIFFPQNGSQIRMPVMETWNHIYLGNFEPNVHTFTSGRYIMEYNTLNRTINQITEIPVGNGITAANLHHAMLTSSGNYIYIFGRSYWCDEWLGCTDNRLYFSYHITRRVVSRPEYLPRDYAAEGILLGQVGNIQYTAQNRNTNPRSIQPHGKKVSNLFDITGYKMGGDGTALEAAVFVPELERSYVVGISGGQRRLLYIHLRLENPCPEIPTSFALDPSVLDCSLKSDGIYAHPQSCNKYIGCRDGEGTSFVCPYPLLFDKNWLRCDYPEFANC